MAKNKYVTGTFTVLNVLTPQEFSITPDRNFKRVKGVAVTTLTGDRSYTINVSDGADTVHVAPVAAALLDAGGNYGPIESKFLPIDIAISNRNIVFQVSRLSLSGSSQIINVTLWLE
jgi:hypothetical protein